MIDKVKKYLRGYLGFFIGAVPPLLITVAMSVCFVIEIANGEFEFELAYLILLLFPLAVVFLIWGGLDEKKHLDEICNNPNTQGWIVNDFEKSQEVLNGKLRLGMVYIFGKHSNTILRYEDLRQAYIYVHKTNGVEDERKLRVVDIHEKTIDLCKLKARGKNMEELESVIKYFLYRNPNIKIGYQ